LNKYLKLHHVKSHSASHDTCQCFSWFRSVNNLSYQCFPSCASSFLSWVQKLSFNTVPLMSTAKLICSKYHVRAATLKAQIMYFHTMLICVCNFHPQEPAALRLICVCSLHFQNHFLPVDRFDSQIYTIQIASLICTLWSPAPETICKKGLWIDVAPFFSDMIFFTLTIFIFFGLVSWWASARSPPEIFYSRFSEPVLVAAVCSSYFLYQAWQTCQWACYWAFV